MKATNRTQDDQSRADAGTTPKAGDRFRCNSCGMEVEVKTDCGCKDGDQVHFQCCGQELARA
jgi:hypothetical protein